MYALADFLNQIPGIPYSDDPMMVRLKSRDRFAVSPLLRKVLANKFADLVVTPRSKKDVLKVAAAAVKHRIPVTARGGGTANYGQSVPLSGGILLDMTALAGVRWVRPGAIRAMAGTVIDDMNLAARHIGRELRMHPTTTRDATIAGFVAGGSGGIGSAAWGMLRDPGNILAIEIVTMEETPRLIELSGGDTGLIHHAYGTNGIITEIEMPLTESCDWIEAIVAFPEFMPVVRFGVRLGSEPGIVKKLLSIQEWPIPRLMRPLNGLVPARHSMISCIIASQSRPQFDDLVAEYGGRIVSACREWEGSYKVPLYEFAFGHALQQVRKSEPRLTAIEGFFIDDDLVGLIERVHRRVADHGPMRIELMRSGGLLTGSGSPFITFESDEQMARIVRLMQAEGAQVANSHTSSILAVGKKEVSARDSSFKREIDPYGLLNPGRFDLDDAEIVRNLPTDGWATRKIS